MPRINPKWIFPVVLLFVTPLGARERTGVLAPPEVKKAQDQILARLKAGNKHYAQHMTRHRGNPLVMVVSCADAHVPPEAVFNMQPGELFTNRAFGNIVDKVILGSLEYGAEHLGCKVLVVMGHTGCTAVRDAISEYDHPRTEWRSLNLQALDQKIEPAVAEVEDTQNKVKAQTGSSLTGDAFVEAVVKANILSTMRAIREQSPILWNLEQQDLLRIVGCVYHKDTGKVEWIK